MQIIPNYPNINDSMDWARNLNKKFRSEIVRIRRKIPEGLGLGWGRSTDSSQLSSLLLRCCLPEFQASSLQVSTLEYRQKVRGVASNVVRVRARAVTREAEAG
ncbi:hypothetical protein L6452_06088 [Arctium lappa]|uniref:Uncharacterized protein n=1 Tax=Arctium lappa TaxID=4217 RepID=A0ACB9EIW1_ARCLA|nr:hypothetical protein L6452_06088 [Arctium lappa]